MKWMRNRTGKILLAVALALGALACGGGGGGSDGSNGSPPTTTLPPASGKARIGGRVVDGPISEATIRFRDPATGRLLLNADGQLISTITSPEGTYRIDIADLSSEQVMIVESQGGTDTGADGLLDANDLPGIALKTLTNPGNSSSVISPITTMVAGKAEITAGATLESLLQNVSSKLGLAPQDVMADPLENSNTAQITQSIALAARLMEKVSGGTGTSAGDLLENFGTLESPLVQRRSFDGSPQIQPQSLLQALNTNQTLSNEARLRAEVLVNASVETLTSLSQQSSQQVLSRSTGESGKTNRATAVLESGTRGLLEAAQQLSRVSVSAENAKGTLSVLGPILVAATQDRINQITQKPTSSFENLSASQVQSEAQKSTASASQLETLVQVVTPLMADSNSLLGKAFTRLNNETSNATTNSSVLNLQLQAITNSMVKESRSFSDTGSVAGTGNALSASEKLAQLRNVVQVTAQIVEKVIDSSFLQSLSTATSSNSSTAEGLLRAAAVTAATNVSAFVNTALQSGNLSQLQAEISSGTGTLLNNAVTIAQRSGQVMAQSLSALDATNLESSLANPTALDVLVTSTNLVNQLTTQNSNVLFTAPISTQTLDTAVQSVQTQLNNALTTATQIVTETVTTTTTTLAGASTTSTSSNPTPTTSNAANTTTTTLASTGSTTTTTLAATGNTTTTTLATTGSTTTTTLATTGSTTTTTLATTGSTTTSTTLATTGSTTTSTTNAGDSTTTTSTTNAGESTTTTSSTVSNTTSTSTTTSTTTTLPPGARNVTLSQSVTGVSLGSLAVRISGGQGVDYRVYSTTTSVRIGSQGERTLQRSEAITQVTFPSQTGIVLGFAGFSFDTVDNFSSLTFSTPLPFGATVQVVNGSTVLATGQ